MTSYQAAKPFRTAAKSPRSNLHKSILQRDFELFSVPPTQVARSKTLSDASAVPSVRYDLRNSCQKKWLRRPENLDSGQRKFLERWAKAGQNSPQTCLATNQFFPFIRPGLMQNLCRNEQVKNRHNVVNTMFDGYINRLIRFYTFFCVE